VNDTQNDREIESEGALTRAFEMRHPGVAMAWKLIRHRPLSGSLLAAGFMVVSTVAFEGMGAANTLFQRWAQTNWYAPFESYTRMEGLNAVQNDLEGQALHLGDNETVRHTLRFYPPDPSDSLPDYLPSIDTIRARDPSVLTRPAQTLKIGRTIIPAFIANGQLAQTAGYAIVWDGAVWGLVPIRDYTDGALPMEDKSQ